MCSRSFGQPIQALSDLEEAVSHYTARATAKLRAGQLYAGELMVFIRTNPFRASVPQYSRSASANLVTPTQDSRVITRQAMTLLRSLYQDGFDYAKAGVMLSELVDGTGLQSDLFEAPGEHNYSEERAARLMAVMDDINRKSRATVTMAREAGPGAYAMRRKHLSPAYTTSWKQLPDVY
jgi:DNA polymerase V